MPVPSVDEKQLKWTAYKNERFGFEFHYPEFWKAEKDVTNGAGRTFTDGTFSVTAEAHFLGAQTFDQWWTETLSKLGSSVTYKAKELNWAVVSGAGPDGLEFYLKRHVQDGNWSQFFAVYPHSMNANYDPLVATMSKKFIPFLEGEYDRVKSDSLEKGTEDLQEMTIVRVDLGGSPEKPTANIFSAPNRTSVHADYSSGGAVGTSWSFLANKKISTIQGTFLSGDLISPRGGKMVNGPYYVLESEWLWSEHEE
jgi:hypothetical protein